MSAVGLDAFRGRLLADLFASGMACTWERRAEQLEWARPRPGDFTGRASRAELDALDQRLAEKARACRAKATVLRRYGVPDYVTAELAELLRLEVTS